MFMFQRSGRNHSDRCSTTFTTGILLCSPNCITAYSTRLRAVYIVLQNCSQPNVSTDRDVNINRVEHENAIKAPWSVTLNQVPYKNKSSPCPEKVHPASLVLMIPFLKSFPTFAYFRCSSTCNLVKAHLK